MVQWKCTDTYGTVHWNFMKFGRKVIQKWVTRQKQKLKSDGGHVEKNVKMQNIKL